MTQDVIQDALHARVHRRPFGLKAIMALLVLQVIAGIGIIAVFILSMNLSPELVRNNVDSVLRAVPFYIAQQSILALLRLVCVIGLWRLKRWAWFLMMLLLTYSMVVDIVAYFLGTAAYLPMFLNVMMVFYLNQSDVQALFAKRGL